jgi:CarboxypepD_reg-like domain
MNKFRILVSFIFLMGVQIAYSQISEQVAPGKGLIQFSGMIVTDENGEMIPVPYASIYINQKNRGTFTGLNGFFSMVVEKNDNVTFSAVGFQKHTIKIPDSLTQDRYSMVQILGRDTILLAETVIFPWPSREHFKLEFLAMDVHNELEKKAMENLSAESLEKQRKIVSVDGIETGTQFLRQQSRQYYYLGQTPPMGLFSPTAWASFFKSWKDGKYKKKK